MLTDEFAIDKTVITGSEGNELVMYYWEFNGGDDVITGLSFDAIKRLSAFLTEYVKKEGGER